MEADCSAGRLLHEESLSIRRELGDRAGIASCLTNLGSIALEQGEYGSARALLTEGLAIRRELANRLGLAECLEAFAALAFGLGRPGRGARLCGQAARLRDEIGSPLPPYERLGHNRRVASARASFGNDAAFDRAWQEGRAMTLEQAVDYALQDHSADG